ncbi:phage terminase large subunit [Candidatus Saccharibacteria bacterium]|nr:phage terminase large subunit [Candidatus Saccharibacteria bacterium]
MTLLDSLESKSKKLQKQKKYDEESELDLDEMLNFPEETRAVLISSLKAFIRFFHLAIHRTEFRFEPFHDVIIEAFEDLVLGRNEKQNLAICISPRTGKSTITQYAITWAYAINKMCNFIATSYAESLTNKFSGEIMEIMRNKYYKRLFGVEISKDTAAKDMWKIKEGGLFRAPPAQGTIVGFGAGIRGSGFGGFIVMDDFINPKFANSDVEKKNSIELYKASIKTRRNNLAKTPMVAIMQRVAQDDLIGYIKENEADDWRFIEFPAIEIDENGEEKSFWEEQYPIASLKKMRVQDPFGFAANYMQKPIPFGGEMIKEEWFGFYSHNPMTTPYPYNRVFISADTAFKTTEYSDYTAIGVWGLTQDKKLHLLDLVHKKIDATLLRGTMINLWNKWANNPTIRRPSAIYIEDKASGMQLIQDLRRLDGLPVLPHKTKNIDKMMRLSDAIPQIESGNILLPINAGHPISREVIAEAVQISRDMTHKHDDIMDMIAIAIEEAYVRRGFF